MDLIRRKFSSNTKVRWRKKSIRPETTRLFTDTCMYSAVGRYLYCCNKIMKQHILYYFNAYILFKEPERI